MKIFQTYYREEQRAKCLPGLIHIDTSRIAGPLLEYDIFKALRHEGDFGVISWRFRQKTQLTKWEETVRDRLRVHDAVVINPFPAIDAVSWNCWDSHPSLIPYAQVDTDRFQHDMAFCSYIFGKRHWWDRYFAFIEARLAGIDSQAYVPNDSHRGQEMSRIPFLIERWLNYTLNDAWLWQYSREHHEKKFGSSVFWELKQCKGTPTWKERRRQFDVLQVAALDAGKKPKERRAHPSNGL